MKKEITIYYGKCDDGTYDVLINEDGRYTANYGGLSEYALQLTFKEYPNATLIDTNELE